MGRKTGTGDADGRNSNFERYFGNNLATVLYIISGIVIAAGLIGIFFRFHIVLFAAVTVAGIVLFFITIRLKITDKDFDEPLNKAVAGYKKEHVGNQTVKRKPVDPDGFDLYYGYLFDQPGLKRKIGTDGKPRSSRFYITALQTGREDFLLSYSEYDVLSGSETHRFIHGEKGDEIRLERPDVKPEIGDFRYTVRLTTATGSETLVFHLPDDALVDEQLALIQSI